MFGSLAVDLKPGRKFRRYPCGVRISIFEWFFIRLVEASCELTLAMLSAETTMLLLCNIIITECVFTAHKSWDLSKSTEGHNSQCLQCSLRWHVVILCTEAYMRYSLTSLSNNIHCVVSPLVFSGVQLLLSNSPSRNCRKAGISMFIRTNLWLKRQRINIQWSKTTDSATCHIQFHQKRALLR